MKPPPKVAAPPAKPLVIYDGDCAFCGRWVNYGRKLTGNAVEYRPYQQSGLMSRYPELRLDDVEQAVHLIETDGSIFRGAEAVLRIKAKVNNCDQLLRWYQASQMFASICDAFYRLVAKHRMFFSRLPWVGCRTCAKPV